MNNGSCYGSVISSSFDPIRELAQNDGDVTLIFLSADGIRYTEPADDDWYGAHRTANNYTFATGGYSARERYYLSDEPASVLGCKEQYQSCNPTLPPETGCSPPLGISSMGFANQLPANKSEWALYYGAHFISVSYILDALQSSALLAKFSLQDNVQAPLPANQWQLEVENWYNIILASLQGFSADNAVGPGSPEMLDHFWKKPSDDIGKSLCENQVRRHSDFILLRSFPKNVH